MSGGRLMETRWRYCCLQLWSGAVSKGSVSGELLVLERKSAGIRSAGVTKKPRQLVLSSDTMHGNREPVEMQIKSCLRSWYR